jgi:hypothetical protein
MEYSHGIAGAEPKKLSLKFKLFVYVGWNVATFLWRQ